MIYANSERCLCMMLIFCLVLSTIASKDDDDSGGEILFDTQYASEEFNFTWKLSNVSHIFDDVNADFNLSLTAWRLRLTHKRFIYLERRDRGEPVNVHVEYDLKTDNKIYQGLEIHKIMKSSRSELKLFDLAHTTYLISVDIKKGISGVSEEDFLKLRCIMKVLGPPVTRKMKSSDSLK